MVQSKQVKHVDWDKEIDSQPTLTIGNPDLSTSTDAEKAERMTLAEIEAKVAQYNHRSSFGTFLMYKFWKRVLDIKVGES